jgi:hypothetical protein
LLQINVQLKETKFAREGIVLDKLSERTLEGFVETDYDAIGSSRCWVVTKCVRGTGLTTSRWLVTEVQSVHCSSRMNFSGNALSLHHDTANKGHPRSSSDVNERKRYVSLVESVREKRGEVVIFSSMHETGQRTSPHV